MGKLPFARLQRVPTALSHPPEARRFTEAHPLAIAPLLIFLFNLQLQYSFAQLPHGVAPNMIGLAFLQVLLWSTPGAAAQILAEDKVVQKFRPIPTPSITAPYDYMQHNMGRVTLSQRDIHP